MEITYGTTQNRALKRSRKAGKLGPSWPRSATLTKSASYISSWGGCIYASSEGSGTASGVNFGGGTNIRLKERTALRLKIRGNANGLGTLAPAGAHQLSSINSGAA